MNIQAFAERCGLTAHTLRYYERIGLLGAVARRDNGHREFGPRDVAWVEVLQRLRETGMPIREMLRYAELREQGIGTEAQRRELLEKHRDRVRAHVDELSACLLVLDTKIGGYAGTDKRMKDYDATLPQRRRRPAGARQTRAR